MPHVTGRVERGGKPFAGATISWYRADEHYMDDPSWELLSRVVSDGDGKFEMEARRHLRFWIPLPSDPGVTWRLKVESAGLSSAVWEQSPLGLGTPSWVVVTCQVGEVSRCSLVDSDDEVLVLQNQPLEGIEPK